MQYELAVKASVLAAESWTDENQMHFLVPFKSVHGSWRILGCAISMRWFWCMCEMLWTVYSVVWSL